MSEEYQLTDEEAVLLDGKVSPETQKEIDAAKVRIEFNARLGVDRKISDFVASAVSVAKEKGELRLSASKMRTCGLCARSAGYRKYPRSGRYHRKGDNDTSKPLYLYGYDLNQGFIVMTGWPSLGCCNECWERVRPVLCKELIGVRAEIAERITGEPPRFRRFDIVQCLECKAVRHEGWWKPLRTMMGDGFYPGKCCDCGQEQLFLRSIKKTLPGFEIVDADWQPDWKRLESKVSI